MSPMRDGRTDGRQTRENRATHPMEAGWLSFANAPPILTVVQPPSVYRPFVASCALERDTYSIPTCKI